MLKNKKILFIIAGVFLLLILGISVLVVSKSNDKIEDLGSNYFKSSKGIYYQDETKYLVDVDKGSFKIVKKDGLDVGEDKNNVFINEQAFTKKEISSNTLQKLNKFYAKSGQFIIRLTRPIRILEGVKSSEFVIFDEDYAKSGQKVYYQGVDLVSKDINADQATFYPINTATARFVRNKEFVYENTLKQEFKRIDDVIAPQSFSLLIVNALDKVSGKIIVHNTYLTDETNIWVNKNSTWQKNGLYQIEDRLIESYQGEEPLNGSILAKAWLPSSNFKPIALNQTYCHEFVKNSYAFLTGDDNRLYNIILKDGSNAYKSFDKPIKVTGKKIVYTKRILKGNCSTETPITTESKENIPEDPNDPIQETVPSFETNTDCEISEFSCYKLIDAQIIN